MIVYKLLGNNDIVDGYVDKFHKETYKTHYCKSDGRCYGYLLEFPLIWFRASFDKTYRILGKLTSWLY